MRSSLSKCLRDRGDGLEQDFLGVLKRPRLVDIGERFLDLPVLCVERFVLADLLKAVFQRLDEQVVLGFGVRRHDLVHQRREQFHLAQRFQPRRDGLDVVKQIVKHRVFRHQDLRDFHDAKILPSKYSFARRFRQPFLGICQPRVPAIVTMKC